MIKYAYIDDISMTFVCYFQGYDGPMQYSMSEDNPDQVISIIPAQTDIEGKFLRTINKFKLTSQTFNLCVIILDFYVFYFVK